MKSLELLGMKCLVTGASSGIGKGTCEVLSQYGAQVIGTGRQEKELAALKEAGVLFDYIVADLTQEGQCAHVVETAALAFQAASQPQYAVDVDHRGTLTTLVIAHGALKGGAVGDDHTNLENYHFNMKLNAQAPFELIQAAVPFLKENSRNIDKNKEAAEEEKEQQQQQASPDQNSTEGAETSLETRTTSCNSSIVVVSSVNGKQSFAGCASYCMSKAAVDQLTRCASVDLAKYGIRVNSVNPGVIQTNLHKTSGMSDEFYDDFLQRSIQMTHPLASYLNRVGQPKEVAELISFLGSDKALFLTGECIAVDGARQNLGAR